MISPRPTTTPVTRLSTETLAACRAVAARRALYATESGLAAIVADARAHGDAELTQDDVQDDTK